MIVRENMNASSSMVHLDELHLKAQQSPSSSRILDIPCKVCGDFSSGKHYNIFACDGCAGFFKRSIRKSRKYTCKAKSEGTCVIDKTHRNQCRACRLQKCQDVGMNKDAVQHERGPRNSTLRRQQMNYIHDGNRMLVTPPHTDVLNLTLTKPESFSPGGVDPLFALRPATTLLYNNIMAIPNFSSTVTQLSPPLLPPPITCSAVCETAARLLFMNVQWTRSVPSFISLPQSDQLILLQDSWRELFVLGSAQFLPISDLSMLVHASGYLVREPNSNEFLQEVREFQDVLSRLNQMQLDQHEYYCLRVIALFKTNVKPGEIKDESSKLTEYRRIAFIHEEMQLALNKYITTAYPNQPLRFGKLLLVLPYMKNITSNTIEELFFRKSIGSIPIVRIICDMYKSQLLQEKSP